MLVISYTPPLHPECHLPLCNSVDCPFTGLNLVAPLLRLRTQAFILHAQVSLPALLGIYYMLMVF